MKFTVSHLRIILVLIAIHSFFVGLGLILVPAQYFIDFGYKPIGENFFRVQGGIFHFAMVIAYVTAALEPFRNKVMIIFAIMVKMLATVFLVSYFIFYDPIVVVLFSGITDFLMALMIFYLSKNVGIFDER